MKREAQVLEIQAEYKDIKQILDERSLRWWCASKSRSYNRVYGRGGVSIVSEATGVSRSRIQRGLQEMTLSKSEEPTNRLRKEGGGRKKNNGEST